jgi:hypothetical protein
MKRMLNIGGHPAPGNIAAPMKIPMVTATPTRIIRE